MHLYSEGCLSSTAGMSCADLQPNAPSRSIARASCPLYLPASDAALSTDLRVQVLTKSTCVRFQVKRRRNEAARASRKRYLPSAAWELQVSAPVVGGTKETRAELQAK